MRRPLVLIAVLLAGLALNACGKADEPTSEGETEAVYLDLDGLQYQVQISRQLNPYDVEDSYYVRGQNEPGARERLSLYGGQVAIDANVTELVPLGERQTAPVGSLAGSVAASRALRTAAAGRRPSHELTREDAVTTEPPDDGT